ncbi:M23 family metallopeptidase [Plantibacter sp. CFBP 8798]|uniref:M23 family metallopeptidase n=1 Tax=Plantibacter sp. CFBP 8798 TaxID=2775268 RepID=UPI0017859DE4|nr:M23 family metallopeptidase [Plantibacter sp. CFBP 8798]MBD8466939.1 M23 family metallopeptidase [Plantibacter sp. CFBP 8798]
MTENADAIEERLFGISRRTLLLSGSGLAALLLTQVYGAPAHAATALRYQFPFSNADTADGWGSMIDRTSPHRGLDFPQPGGTPVGSVAEGVVRISEYTAELGNAIVVEHPDGWFSGYSHLLDGSRVQAGIPVLRGGTIGQVGNTGSASRGNHLHLTISDTARGYYSGTTIDPYPFITDRLNNPDTTPETPPRKEVTMRLIEAEGRGIAVVGAGYYKVLTGEEVPYAVNLYGDPVKGNVREFDLYRSIHVNGEGAIARTA